MASGPLGDGGGAATTAAAPGGAVSGDAPREKLRWIENKVYTRKIHRNIPKPNPNPQPQPQQPPGPPVEVVDLSAPPADGDATLTNGVAEVPLVSHRVENGELHRVINLGASPSSPEARELRRKLGEELEQVRGLIRKLEARAQQIAVTPVAVPVSPPVPVLTRINSLPVAPASDVVLTKRPVAVSLDTSAAAVLRRQLSVSVPSGHLENHGAGDTFEKEKRTPKANQFYRNSDFITGKDRLPISDSYRKSKANGGKKNADHVSVGVDRFYAHAFKSCSALLTRLMKHKHGWVFNTPVDVKGLGLYDYHLIIKHPMDLGTVKSRLNSNWYKSPREFAEDVRLTFNNAMTYNPKGQDVHIMAEQLLKIFEEKWPSIEAELTMPLYSMIPRKVPPPQLDMRRILERSDSTAHQVLLESTPRSVSYTPQSIRPPALKKPKAKDLHKREMTFEEKQKLSNNLTNLPHEKLDIVVQIIKKRNLTVKQHDDEIEVDIDSVDTETLWELDRFVTNYKKSLSKHKRKAELALQAKLEAERKAQMLQNQAAVVSEVPVEGKTDEKNEGYTSPAGDKDKGDNESASTSSSSSSSDSGSSSSDSDSESSSS